MTRFPARSPSRRTTTKFATEPVTSSGLTIVSGGTDAGERLIARIGPRLDEIEDELAALSALRDKPAGTIRITTAEHATATILSPVLHRLLPDHPAIIVEVAIDNGLTDIVAERYDAGIRLGEQVERGMMAVPGPDQRMAVVAAPAYFEARPKPLRPQDLTQHNCINFRRPTRGGVYAWEFGRDGRELKVRVEGQFVFNTVAPTLEASLAGVAIAYLPEDLVAPYLAAGRLVRVLEDWCAPYPGYHLYYPSRRQTQPAFALLAEAPRYRG